MIRGYNMNIALTLIKDSSLLNYKFQETDETDEINIRFAKISQTSQKLLGRIS